MEITVIISGINLRFDDRKYLITELAIINSTIETMKYSVVPREERRIPKRQSSRMEIERQRQLRGQEKQTMTKQGQLHIEKKTHRTLDEVRYSRTSAMLLIVNSYRCKIPR